jgi:hypothetical protein
MNGTRRKLLRKPWNGSVSVLFSRAKMTMYHRQNNNFDSSETNWSSAPRLQRRFTVLLGLLPVIAFGQTIMALAPWLFCHVVDDWVDKAWPAVGGTADQLVYLLFDGISVHRTILRTVVVAEHIYMFV